MSEDAALLELLSELKSRDYHFTCVSPATHERVLARTAVGEPTLRDIFGWNQPFHREQLDGGLFALLERANCLEQDGNRLRSRVRVATLGELLLLHSSFPTDSGDAIFFGPDSYRFARFLQANAALIEQASSIVDMGAGSGIGGIFCNRLARAARVTLVDINPAALRLARINAEAARVAVQACCAGSIPAGHDLIIANPPYMADERGRTYRDGGGLVGGERSLAWTREALDALQPGGTTLLYTGAAVVNGSAPLLDAIQEACAGRGASCVAEEIDPDVFGEELARPAYARVERIAVVGLRITTAA